MVEALFHNHINMNLDRFLHRRLALTDFFAVVLVECLASLSYLPAPMSCSQSLATFALLRRQSAALVLRCLRANVVPSWSSHHGSRPATPPTLSAIRVSCRDRGQIPSSFPCHFIPLPWPSPPKLHITLLKKSSAHILMACRRSLFSTVLHVMSIVPQMI